MTFLLSFKAGSQEPGRLLTRGRSLVPWHLEIVRKADIIIEVSEAAAACAEIGACTVG